MYCIDRKVVMPRFQVSALRCGACPCSFPVGGQRLVNQGGCSGGGESCRNSPVVPGTGEVTGYGSGHCE